MNILGHPRGIAGDVKVGSVLKPGPKFLCIFQHSMLHINLVLLVARKSQIKPMQFALLLIIKQLLAIEKIRGAMLFAEDQPSAAAGPFERALFQEGTTRGETRSRTHHYDID